MGFFEGRLSMTRDSRNNSSGALQRSRRLRSEMSLSERRLWGKIRRKHLGFHFKRQVPVGPYCLDFYCPEASLCVEVDGELHATRGSSDARRDSYLIDHGISTMRIPSLDLFGDDYGASLGQWLETIQRECEARTGRSAFG